MNEILSICNMLVFMDYSIELVIEEMTKPLCCDRRAFGIATLE